MKSQSSLTSALLVSSKHKSSLLSSERKDVQMDRDGEEWRGRKGRELDGRGWLITNISTQKEGTCNFTPIPHKLSCSQTPKAGKTARESKRVKEQKSDRMKGRKETTHYRHGWTCVQGLPSLGIAGSGSESKRRSVCVCVGHHLRNIMSTYMGMRAEKSSALAKPGGIPRTLILWSPLMS